MKKILLLVCSLMMLGQIHAYTISFKNMTPFTLEANIIYGSKRQGSCYSSSVKIVPTSQITPITKHDTGCCIKSIQFKRVDAAAPKAPIGPIVDDFYPDITDPLTNESCKSMLITIEANPDGSLYTYSY